MSRRRAADIRVMVPDSKYNHTVISRFINYVMWCGQKSKAESLVYDALAKMSEEVKVGAVEAFESAISNVRPVVEVRSRRVGGATYQVPIDVSARRSVALALRWIVSVVRAKSGAKSFSEKLASELVDAYNGRGAAVKKKDDTHKMAEANKAFAHYKW